jgi:hypothetical protein
MYIALPYELYEAYNNGEITDSMYEVMVWLHRRADWGSGKVRMVSAERIAVECGLRFKPRTIQDALKNLDDCGWITSHHLQGKHGSYWITVNNFTALIGALKEQVANAKEVMAYKNGCPVGCGDDRGEVVSENVSDDCGDGAPIQRPRDPEPPEPTDKSNEGMKEGSKESSGRSAPSATQATGQPSKPKRPLFNPLAHWVKPLDKEPTEEELEQLWDEPYEIWEKRTGTPFLDFTEREDGWSDQNAGIRIIRTQGYEVFMDTLRGTWECPKTAKYVWRDFSYWCEHCEETRSTLLAWRNKVEAQQQAKHSANGNGHAPLWVYKKQDDGTTLRSLGRKPMTAAERGELVGLLGQPKINREYVLGFLVQDDCSECGGQDINCKRCVITSEVMRK